MPPAIPVIAAVASVASIGKTAYDMVKERKMAKGPAITPLPQAPTVEAAKTTAKDEVERRRRKSLLSGGNTDITKGSAILQPGDVSKKSLLGA